MLKIIKNKIRTRIEKTIALKRIETIKDQPLLYGLSKEKRNPQIIISLTTFPARIGTVSLCIKSLLSQTMKPDKVILYLGDDVKNDMIPADLKSLENYGLTIITGCCNIKPHKKYYYAMQKYPNDIVITTDDDIVYEDDLVERLMNAHMEYPSAVICGRANVITRDATGKIEPYLKWPAIYSYKLKERFDLLPTGVGGVLYPPHSISEMAFNIEDIEKHCLNADDVWLRYMGVKTGTPVVCALPKVQYCAVIPYSQESALYKSNVGQNRNDYYISHMQEIYGWSIDRK